MVLRRRCSRWILSPAAREAETPIARGEAGSPPLRRTAARRPQPRKRILGFPGLPVPSSARLRAFLHSPAVRAGPAPAEGTRGQGRSWEPRASRTAARLGCKVSGESATWSPDKLPKEIFLGAV
ncbi:high mobility group nucleosome-binding domain-containing protein 4 isoform X1 [Diceros bicornis minor]|uniref:high mobility group nucleosome-binding domain-containing protein 4 isoform X1 n=1 Tax=Diceros bicornis minor TaxID=77932 RepID=UPI0026F12165|nr:high mobility group nucleosome-binding domain-containing protein 4 isoform X1 [Diceros bicornis minor]